jgi:hypothetical protein
MVDQRAKTRSFEVADFVYLFNKARKPGLSKTFHRVWTGPFQITARISDLNYEIIGENGRKQVVHINRLKPAHGSYTQTSKPGPGNKQRDRRHSTIRQASEEMSAAKIGSRPLTIETPRQDSASRNRLLLLNPPLTPSRTHPGLRGWTRRTSRTIPLGRGKSGAHVRNLR